MFPSAWASADPGHLIALATVALLVALLLGRALLAVGFTLSEAGLLVVAAPIFSATELPWILIERGEALVYANVAGFAIPVVVGVKVLVERRVRIAPALAALSAASLVAYPVSTAIPNEGILLYYRVPALAAGLVAVALCWRRWHEAGPVAFLAGSGGVILGADLSRLPELLAAEGGRRVVLGGAGVLDGIFLVGLLAAMICVVASGLDTATRRQPRPRGPVEFTWVRPDPEARPPG